MIEAEITLLPASGDHVVSSAPHPSSRTMADVLYADAFCLVEKAWQAGVPKSVPIRTSSPGLLAMGLEQVEAMDASVTPRRIVALEDAALGIAADLYEYLAPDHHHGVAAARAAFSPLQVRLLKAAALLDEDLTRNVAVARVTSATGGANRYLGVIDELLQENNNLTTIDVPEEDLADFVESAPPTPSLMTRLGYLTGSALRYRMHLQLSRLRRSHRTGTILVLRENELVKETASALIKSGYRIRRVSMPGRPDPEASAPEHLVQEAQSIAERRLGPVLPADIAKATARCFANLVRNASGRYLGLIEPWRQAMSLPGGDRPAAVLTNFLPDAGAVALHKAASDLGVAVAVFQHGVTMEIHERARLSHLIHENAAADLAIAFNPAARAALENSRFGIGASVAVGLPKDYGRLTRGGARRSLPPVWYVSTSLYMGNQGLLYTGVNDRDKAQYEQTVVENVLARLPHEVLYKPYPGVRYLDPDPVVAAAERAPNVQVFEERIDLRYIVGAAKVLITSRSYSTPSWCLMTGKPLVHIDVPGQAALLPEARAAFEAGVFLFDAGATDFHERLRQFLSRPLPEIEAEYAAKQPARQALIEQFISGPQGHAGTAAAKAIADHLAGLREN